MPNVEEVRKEKVSWWSSIFDSWVARVGAIVTVLGGIVGLYHAFHGGDAKTVQNFNLVTDVTVIQNQYQTATGQQLSDPATIELIRSAVNLAKAKQYPESKKLFQQVAAKVPVPAVFNNIGALEAEAGNIQGAQQAYQQALAKDSDYKPALDNLQKLTTIEQPKATSVTGQEAEPNNDFNHTNEMPIGSKIAASIGESSDADFYQFKTPTGPRDLFEGVVENGGTVLRPWLQVFDNNSHKVAETNAYLGEPLRHVEASFSASPQSSYFIQVSGLGGTAGPYTVLVHPLKRYDAFEPSDDFPQAKPISFGSAIDANIMDNMDTDYYEVHSASKGQATARFDNGGTMLRPLITVYDSNHHQIAQTSPYISEALASVEAPFAAEAGGKYFVQVSGLGGTAGSYKLVVK